WSAGTRWISSCSARDPRHLHSFPTRRSSDLALSSLRWERPQVELPTQSRDARLPGALGACQIRRPLALALWPQLSRPRSRRSQRSEEHTSELQSLAYLVCRLLLEKKMSLLVL